MKIIRPTALTDATLTASNVAETDYAEFLMDTTYGDGDTRIVSTGVEVLTLDVAPATPWIANRLITGQTSAVTSRVVAQLTTLTYQIRERTGVYTLGEIIGVTGTAGELADQGPTYPQITEILKIDVAPATDWAAADVLTGQTSTFTCVVVAKLTNYTYSIKSRTGAFTLDETIGVTGTAAKLANQGAAFPVVIPSGVGIHKIYESLVAGNRSNYPPTDVLATVPKWLEISATNRWKAFDQKVGSQTSQATSITYTITPGVIVDSIAFLNLDAVTVRIVSTAGGVVVYDKTTDLISTVITGSYGVYDWYSYFFSTEFKLTDIVFLDLPPYLNAILTITITYTGGTAKVGGIVLGVQANLGITQYSPSIGIHDYSIKEQDVWGVYSITERTFSKKMSCDILVESVSIADVQNLLASYRSTLLIWIGSEDYPSLIVYGFYKDFNIVISYPTFAIMSLEVEGLT